MAKDLRHFLQQVQTRIPSDFVRITKCVNPDREPAALLKRLNAESRSPILLFEQIKGADMPLIVNCHDTRRRLAMALSVEENQINHVYGKRLRTPIKPVMVDHGPVKDVVFRDDAIDLNALPFVRPSDNAPVPYLGGGVLLAKDPESGVANLSFNRLMRQNRRHFGFHAAPGLDLARICDAAEKRGEPLPVAIMIGHHPAFSLGTLAKVPFEVNEYDCAGGMLGEPVELVACETVPLEVPAHAEVILEGQVLPNVRQLEGPYDEFTGYAMAAEMQPVIEITCITHRRDAIWQDIFGGSDEHLLMGAIPKESSQLHNLQQQFPFVKDLHMPTSGGGRLHAVIALGPHPPGQGREVLEKALAFDHFLKHVFVVDDDIDIRDDKALFWAMATRFQAESDLVCQTQKLGSSLDPSASASYHASKLGFDCTRKKTNFPPTNRIDPIVLKRMNPDDYLPGDPHGKR